MISLLARLFIKTDGQSPAAVRKAYGILCGAVGIGFNVLLFLGKFFAGTISGSIAITADAFNNLSDAGSSFVTMLGFQLAGQKPDSDHPFGHGRFEYLASLTISIIILVVGYKLCETSIEKFFEPEDMEFSYWSIGVLVISIAVKVWMCLYNRYIGKKINSGVNDATAADSITDAIATTGVLVATIAQQFTTLPIDAAAGTAIGLMIMYAGYGIAKDVINILLGKAPDPELVRGIVAMALKCPHVVGVHDIRIHDYGPGRMFGSIHAEVPDKADLVEVHAALDVLEDELQDKYHMEVNIHMDPLCTDIHQINAVRRVLDQIVHEKYPRYHTDHLRITSGHARLNVICDIHIPPAEYNVESIARIRRDINDSMRKYNDRYRVVLAKIMADPGK